jgi:hypothetical protein
MTSADGKNKQDNAWTIILVDGVWWRTCCFIPNCEALVVETDKKDLDSWLGESALQLRARLLWAYATKSQQEQWVRENPGNPYFQTDSDAAREQHVVVDALYEAIRAVGTGSELTKRFHPSQRYPIHLRRRNHPEWKTLSASRGEYKKYLAGLALLRKAKS